jgi:molybdopterin-guanine dinucleotide biosynthesis protein A
MSFRPTAAAILAGGKARRFGGLDKSRLVVEDRPIIARQIEVLQRVTAHVFIVGGPPTRFADLELPVYQDAVEAGALGGILTALEQAEADRVLVVACDLPLLDAGLLALLLDRAQHHDGAWVATASGPEPLLACYRSRARDRVRAQIEAGQWKAANLASVLDLAVVAEPELAAFGPTRRLLANLNSEEDLRALHTIESS